MFPGIGTVLNVLTIILGSVAGVFIGEKLRDQTRNLVTDVLGLATILGAAGAIIPLFREQYSSAIPSGWSTMPILIALLFGGIIGSILKIEDRFETLGITLRRKFRSSQGTFVEGFLASSLLFVIGPLAILGSISDGMENGIDQLVLKSILDGFAAMAFASSLGWGVAASAIPVAIYQGLWTAIGFFLGNVMQPYQVDAMTITGGLLLLGIAFRLLKIKNIAIGNLLPALFLAPVVALLFNSFS
ncbi:MAG: DUF554 domain-containing protein [Candidatus Nanopelagicaceae bacterium]